MLQHAEEKGGARGAFLHVPPPPRPRPSRSAPRVLPAATPLLALCSCCTRVLRPNSGKLDAMYAHTSVVVC